MVEAYVGACKPGLLPGLFWTMRTHIMRTGRKAHGNYTVHSNEYCICMPKHRRMYSIQCSDKKILSAIVHQMQHSQVLPGYPHSSAGAYGWRVIQLTSSTLTKSICSLAFSRYTESKTSFIQTCSWRLYCTQQWIHSTHSYQGPVFLQ